MKIKTGKPTVSQAVMIGVLLFVFWTVFPGKGSYSGTSADSSQASSESGKEVQPTVRSEDAVASRAESKGGLAKPEATDSFLTFQLPVRPLPVPSADELTDLIAHDPFFTTAARVQTSKNSSVLEVVSSPASSQPDETSVSGSQMTNAKLSLIYSSTTGRSAAILNNRILRNGESDEEGIALLHVNEDSIAVRPLATQPSPGHSQAASAIERSE